MTDTPQDSPQTWLEDHGPALYSYALLLTRDKTRAEEVVQETLLAGLLAHARFTGRSSVRTWLTGILKHKVMDLYRRDAREVSLDALEDLAGPGDDGDFAADGHWRERPAAWGNPEQDFLQNEFLLLLQRCLDGLPARLAQAFWLAEILEEPTETVCKELAVTSTNFWTMLYRARMGLRRCLDGSGFVGKSLTS